MNNKLVADIGKGLRSRSEWLATAESCTGGLIARLLTDVAGSSQWFERGIVSYSNAAKIELLGVPVSVIDEHGAVSQPCAEAMAAGLLGRAPVQWTLSVTGIAGPGGGSKDKPVGTVWIAVAHAGGAAARLYNFQGDRESIRQQAAEAALRDLHSKLS